MRWRLAAVSAGLTLAILVLFGAIVGNLAAQRVRDDFNREMKGAVATLASQVQIVDTITNTLIVREPDLGDFVSPNDASVRIYDARGQQLDASPNAAELGPPAPGVHDVGEMRVVTVALRSRQSGRIAGYVQYGRNEQHVDSTIDRLWLFIAAGVLGATLLASLAGVAIARRAMRPISSLTVTARKIAATGDPSSHMPQPRADDEVGELAKTLEQMLRSLDAARAERETALKRQREFVADASHELRTPLTSILANLELLQASLEETAREDERAMVDSALRSSSRMSRLVGDLLLLARADAGRIGARTRCDLADDGRQRRRGGRADDRRTDAAGRERAPAAGRRQPRRAAPHGPQPARQRRPPHARRLDDRAATARRGQTTRSSKSPTTARACRRSCASRSSSASSAARGRPTPRSAAAAASAWRSSAPWWPRTEAAPKSASRSWAAPSSASACRCAAPSLSGELTLL